MRLLGFLEKGFDSCITGSSFRNIDDSGQRVIVVRLIDNTQVIEDQFDFCAFVKFETACTPLLAYVDSFILKIVSQYIPTIR